jgi:hypothetical protein
MESFVGTLEWVGHTGGHLWSETGFGYSQVVGMTR